MEDNERDFLIKIYEEISQDIRHCESIISDHLNYFFLTILAFSTFISSILLWSFQYCTANNFICQKTWVRIAEILFLPDEAVALIFYAGLVVLIVCYSILLIITKSNRIKVGKNKILRGLKDKMFLSENIENFLNNSLEIELNAKDCFSKIFLIGRISKLLPFSYMFFFCAFEVYLLILQYLNKINFNFSMRIEVIVLSMEVIALSSYLFNHVFVWETDINNCRRELVLKFVK